MWAVRVGLLLPVWILSLGCAAGLDTDPRILTGTLVVDRAFSTEQRAEVLRAVEMWREATEARFAPEVVFGEVACGQPFAIEAVQAEGCHVGQAVAEQNEAANERVLGAADRDSHWVSVVSWLQGKDFRNNVAHELGHYLLLGHGEGIMAQARRHQPARVAETSVSEFCAIWGACDARIVPDGPQGE
ncbi:MAG TPA: hypothetical protein VJU61_20320 [Polyangiaceae bacterium]|nr:hypothetical protein [Polyangiaceae bacterium]